MVPNVLIIHLVIMPLYVDNGIISFGDYLELMAIHL